MNDPENGGKETPFYFRPEYQILFCHSATVSFDNEETRFAVVSRTFEPYEDSDGTMQYGKEAELMMKEYNVTANDCGTPGIETKLAFKHISRVCKTPRIENLSFIMFSLDDENAEKALWQQEHLDHGMPENVEVDYLYMLIPAGFNPRLHERLNYEYLYFHQNYSHEEKRMYQTVNEKMLKCKLLALSCFIENPEVLSRFEGWGLLVNLSVDNAIDKSLLEDVIDSWIENKPVRRLTGLFDRHVQCDDEYCPKRIMSTEEQEAVVEKLCSACSNFIKENIGDRLCEEDVKLVKTRIRFTRKTDGAEGDLYIYFENSDCVGMAFLQPPDEETQYFLTNIYSF